MTNDNKSFYSAKYVEYILLWHCALVSSTSSQSIGLVYGCALFWWWVSLGAHVTISLTEFSFIMIFIVIDVTIIGIFMAIHYLLNYTLSFLQLSSSGSANAQLPGCFYPGHSPWILDWTCYLRTPLCHVCIPYWNIPQGSSRLCNWLSLRHLVP